MKRIYTILICLGVGICLIFAGISVGGLNEVSNFNFLRSWNFRWHYKSADNIQYRSSSSVDRLEINVHKGNIQKFTEGGFRKWGYEVAQEDYKEELLDGRLEINDIIADNFLQQILLNPEKFDVVALTNLNGDYASDALAAQVGGIGISPGANINYQTGHAIFEATHGTAPDIADQDKANPCSVLLSGCMLLDYIGWTEAAQLITSAIEKTFKADIFTADLAFGKQAYSTSAFSNQILSIM